MRKVIRIESISQLHELIGYEKPKHPLISVIDYSKTKPAISTADLHIITAFYSINLKEGPSCKTKYGRQYYDFEEGSLVFLAPDKAVYIEEDQPEEPESTGWNLCFHPDLIYKSSLSQKINDYTFFTYEQNEALHLSDQEKQKITDIVYEIKHEYSQNMDDYSQDLIISQLELFLNYCQRFYGRQFMTRTKVNKKVVTRVDEFLKDYFQSDKLQLLGPPSVKYCAQAMGYSPNYLSDLLKKETGKNTQEHIYFHLIEKAKMLLLETDEPVRTIASELGFEYPQHFSKLFKNKTGRSPAEYRN